MLVAVYCVIILLKTKLCYSNNLNVIKRVVHVINTTNTVSRPFKLHFTHVLFEAMIKFRLSLDTQVL